MNRENSRGSGLLKAASYLWDAYCRFADRFETVFLGSAVFRSSRGFAEYACACLEGSGMFRIARSSNEDIYNNSGILANTGKLFRAAESAVSGSFYESGLCKMIRRSRKDILIAPVKALSFTVIVVITVKAVLGAVLGTKAGVYGLTAEALVLFVSANLFLAVTDWNKLKDNSKVVGYIRRCSRKK